jgi:uncharacterized protein YuzE
MRRQIFYGFCYPTIVDYTREGKVVGIELLDASESVADPYTVQLNVPASLAKTAA